MNIDFEFIQGFFVVAAVGTKPSEHDSPERIHNNLIGMGGEKILRLRKVVANGNNRFATLFKALQSTADLFQLGNTAASHIVGVQQNMGDALIVLGVIQRLDDVAY